MGTKVSMQGGDALKKILKNIKEQTQGAEVQAGFTDTKYATVAFQNEYGGWYPTSEEWREKAKRKGIEYPPTQAHIQARPFMLDTVLDKGKSWGNVLVKALNATKFDVKQSLEFLGQTMQKDIQNTITEGNYPPTGEPYATVKGNSRPLVDSGGMLDNVTYQVKIT